MLRYFWVWSEKGFVALQKKTGKVLQILHQGKARNYSPNLYLRTHIKPGFGIQLSIPFKDSKLYALYLRLEVEIQ